MRLTAPNSWVGNVYNPVEGRIYTDVKLTLVSRQQIVLRGCRTWLMCGEKIWTRSTLPPDATTPELIEVKAPAEPGTPEKAEPRSAPQPEAPMIEASLERESLAAPGFTLVTSAREDSLQLSGDGVLSMVTGVAPAATTPSPTETAAADEQWPWMQRRSVRLASTRNVAQAQAVPATPSFAKPKPKPVVMAAQRQWRWQQRRARTAAQAPAPGLATPIVVKAKPKPVVRESQEQWPWVQRRSVVVVATRTAGY
jgi:hypothetical protein